MNKETDRCFACNSELSPYGPPNEDGEPSMDCLVCRLRDNLRELRAEMDRRHEEYSKALNRRTDVETVLLSVAAGKREPLTPEECRTLAQKLGNP